VKRSGIRVPEHLFAAFLFFKGDHLRKLFLIIFLFLFTVIPSLVQAATGTILLPVQAAKLPASNPARIDGGQNRWYLLFDAATSQSGQWQFRLPANYSSGLTAKIQYAMASATSGNVIFRVSVMAVSDGDAADVETDSFATANTSATTTVPGTAGYMDEISVSLTNDDGAAAGDLIIIKLDRDAATDSATGDAEVFNVVLEFTSI